MCYLDDILIYSTNEKEHEDHVRKLLQRLREFGLHSKAAKSQFGVSEVGFVGFIINSDGIGMETDLISTIEDWPTLKSIWDVQVVLGFTNLYRRFIRNYAKIILPLTNLLKRTEISLETRPKSALKAQRKPTKNGNGLEKRDLPFRSSRRPSPGHRVTSVSTQLSQPSSRQMQAASQLPASSISMTVSGSSGQSTSILENAPLPNRSTTRTIGNL